MMNNKKAISEIMEQQPCEDCRNCKEYNECPCGKEGHENGTSIGYSIGECKNYEPCDDCISRQATVKRLCEIGDFMNEKREGLGSPYIMAALFIQDNKEEFPPVTSKEKTGKGV